jgi:hypothetical protein
MKRISGILAVLTTATACNVAKSSSAKSQSASNINNEAPKTKTEVLLSCSESAHDRVGNDHLTVAVSVEGNVLKEGQQYPGQVILSAKYDGVERIRDVVVVVGASNAFTLRSNEGSAALDYVPGAQGKNVVLNIKQLELEFARSGCSVRDSSAHVPENTSSGTAPPSA